ncbi:MAG TPA: O-acetylhomoserine aminocarboxypropyltransferase/cysteine synthase [Sediminispirochaeta sp.]|nr:O-acetylhomoserine aminocarboxypropyltransferase/cysteine synthase [Sediminispirochaeta sp.]
MEKSKKRFETLALHEGHRVDSDTGSRAVPLYRTTAYLFQDSEHAKRLFSLEEGGNIYTRIGNPTQEVLEKRLAALEGAPAALALASGTAAIFYSIINIAGQGDRIIAPRNLYGGTYTMFDHILPQFGIQTDFVDPGTPDQVVDQIAERIDERTKALFCETIGNPGLEVCDLESLAEIAHRNGLPLIVDSTFTTPYLLRPLEYGADIVVHSLTKWIGGHGTAIGGAVVDGGCFDWRASGRFPSLGEPDESYHGLVWADIEPGEGMSPFITKMRTGALRNLGAAIAPDNAWIFLQGLETLALRMERHCENALSVARFLRQHPQVDWVRYPGLEDDPSHQAARKYLSNGYGGMVVFGVKGGRAAGTRFIEGLRLFSHLANVGDAKSLVIHPAGTTHSQMSDEQQRAAGLAPELIRLSIGIEHIDDIKADLDGALKKISQ